jgi:integrase/recombinase XerD
MEPETPGETLAFTEPVLDLPPVPEMPLPPPLRAHSDLATAIVAFGKYMRGSPNDYTDNTIKAFLNDLNILKGFMQGDTQLREIGTKDLEEFLNWMLYERGTACSPKTLARRITTLKAFFTWLQETGVLGSNAADPIVQQPVRTPLPKILRDDEVGKLVRAAQDLLFDRKQPDARPLFLISLLLQTGMKKSEVAKLEVDDVDITEPSHPVVAIKYKEARFAHKSRRLPLDPNIVSAYRQYVTQYKANGLLFECTPRNLEYVLDEVGTRASIRSTQVGFETLRWTCAVRDFRNGVPEEQLREKLGLSKISWRETRAKIYRITGREP